MIKKILEKLLFKKMGCIPYETYQAILKANEQLYNTLKLKQNEINNLKKRIKYATEKKYL